MPKRNIIVVGASAGGIDALKRFVSGLPSDLQASLFVVLHLPRWAKSELPAILSRSGPLPAMHPRQNQPVQPGMIYVAPPDFHLLLDDHKIQLWRGPTENRNRPAINALFRSAAVAHREKVVGIVLSGCLDDGTTGLWWIKRHGGVAIVQDPTESAHPQMPRNALAHVEVDYVLETPRMGPLLAQLATGPPKKEGTHGNET